MPAPRRGVPQGRHLHGLLPRRRQALDGLFPGLVDEMVSEGAPRAEFLSEVRLVFSGHQLARDKAGVSSIQASRPLLESRLRARVAGLANVKHDSQVATAFVRVAALLDPPSAIATPRIMARVLAGGHRRTS